MKNYKEMMEAVKKSKNSNQKYLCYENTLFHSFNEGEKAVQECQVQMKKLEREEGFTLKKVSIVIVSYNNGTLMKECIKSIRKNCFQETYQLVVVDNASTDGILEWLLEQKDIILIANTENKGFPYACNQGITSADIETDIFLLNNDTIVPENALFWLRMGLYESISIGAAGSVSNSAVNYQQVLQQYETLEEWMTFAEKNNVFMEYPYEKKAWLMGFAMLIKREAINEIINKVGKVREEIPEVLDNRFFPGNYEDNDLSIRLLKLGYQLLLCRNSFIFHYGGKSFGKSKDKYVKLLRENQRKLADKYGIDFIPYSYIESALVNMINSVEPVFSVLEIGCRMGATLAKIQGKYPQAEVFGIEKNPKLAELAQNIVSIENGDILELSHQKKYDYVILDNVLKQKETGKYMLEKALEYLKPEGNLIISVTNRQCIRHADKGFTLDEIVGLFNSLHLQLKEFNYRSLVCNAEERTKLQDILRRIDELQRPLYEAERFIFAAGRER